MSRAVLLIAIASAIVACGTSAAPTAPVAPAKVVAPHLPLDQDMPGLATRTVTFYEAAAAALTAANATCATARVQFGGVKTANADYLAARATVIADGRTRALQDAIDANEVHGQPLATAAILIVGAPLMKTCATDRAFTDAYEDLFGAVR